MDQCPFLRVMPGTSPGPSIKAPKVYEALRRQGMSKARAARISNAQAHKDAAPVAGAMAHGPGGLLSTPGMGGRKPRKGRKWGMRTKAANYGARAGETITGNLGRSASGQFTRAGGPPSTAPLRNDFKKPLGAAKKPRKARAGAKPKQTPEQRIAATEAKHQQNVNDVGDQLDAADALAGIDAYNKGQPLDPAIQKDIVDAGLGELGRDGAMRLTAQGREALHAAQRGDVGAARDALSRARDAKATGQERVTARAGREQAAAQKRQEVQARHEAVAARRAATAAAKKPAKAGSDSKKPAQAAPKAPAAKPAHAAPRHSAAPSGGGSSGGGSSAAAPKPKPKPAAPAAAPKPAAPKQPAAAKPTISPKLRDAASAVSEGADVTDEQLQQLVTNGLVKLNRDGEPILTAAGLRATMKAQAIARWNGNAWIKDGVVVTEPDQSQFAGYTMEDWGHDRPKKKPTAAAVEVVRAQFAQALGVDTVAQPASFTVFKDATGTPRWLSRTTTAYRDRDGEIISEAALDSDSQRMMATKAFGPLRYWHVGQPDPFDESAPWGQGLDIGQCDYSVVIGRTRVESGTFKSAELAHQMAAVADRHEMSPGFFHPLDQPDESGVFNSIRTFERSPVPKRYTRASNLFTGFTVKEFRMEVAEMERRFKAMYQELGLTPEQGMELGQSLIATEKAAAQQGIAFKETEQPELPDVVINGVTYKAFPPKAAADAPMDAEDDPALGGDMGVDEAAEGEPPIGDEPMAGDYLGDMSWDEFAAKITDLLAPVLKVQDLHKGMTDALGEMKAMYGGVATKDAGVQAEIASLKARLAEIEGDQPATILPDQVAEALKSEGPAKPQEPERTAITQAINDPTRPFAGWGAQTFPEIYKNGENA